uniref:Uncharacterized protein n=1 Tax=Onchocerca volvulus TaxID=6282 RepID=A0A8R1XYZ1_ONCVO
MLLMYTYILGSRFFRAEIARNDVKEMIQNTDGVINKICILKLKVKFEFFLLTLFFSSL